MVDEPRKFDDDEEYQFNETDITEDFAAVEGDEPYQSAANRWRRIVIVVVGLVISMVAVYQLLDYFNAPQEIQPAIPEITPDFNEPKPIVTPPPQQPKPVVSKPPVVLPTPQRNADTDELRRTVAQLRSTQTANRAQLNSLAANINNLQSSIEQVAKDLQKFNYTMEKMTVELADYKRELAYVRSMAQELKSAHEEPQVSSVQRKQYYIQALIPGRVWLKSAHGRDNVTVVEGSNLSGYGTVTVIDPHQGEVLTSSGRVIRFSPDDA